MVIMRIVLIILISILLLLIAFFGYSIVLKNFFAPKYETSVTIVNQNESIEKAIQIEILNSTGTSGLANKMMNELRKKGFDVVKIGNYSDTCSATTVYHRLGDSSLSINVARAIGLADSLVIIAIDSSLFLNTTVVIGNDFNQLKVFNN